MMLRKLFEVYPSAAPFFLSRLPEEVFEKQGIRSAIRTAHQASTRVPAYQKFLAQHSMDTYAVKTIEDFKELPLMDKESYVHRYAIDELCLDGTLCGKYLIDGSSGYGGKRSYWPRFPKEDQDFPTFMELAYRQFYHIDRLDTLVIITLGLGTWVGGEKISWATRQIAIKGRNRITVMTPGMQFDEILDIVKHLGHQYEQVVIVGYPLYVKRIIDEGAESGINWQKMNIKLALGGEGYSEAWRDRMSEKIGLAKNDLMGIGSNYGAADLGLSVGRESPLTVLLRKLANEDEALARDLFGQPDQVPSLCQYNPSAFFIEEVDGELVFTASPAVPVVRYNIHDRGGIIPFKRALDIASRHGYQPLQMLADYGYQRKDVWNLPFLYVWGRSGRAGSISIFGLIIYTESIKAALDQPCISTYITGHFVMESISDLDTYLLIKIELASGIEPDCEIERKLVQIVTATLEEQNSEYKELRLTMKDKVLPHIKLFRYQDPEVFDPDSIKSRYTA